MVLSYAIKSKIDVCRVFRIFQQEQKLNEALNFEFTLHARRSKFVDSKFCELLLRATQQIGGGLNDARISS